MAYLVEGRVYAGDGLLVNGVPGTNLQHSLAPVCRAIYCDWARNKRGEIENFEGRLAILVRLLPEFCARPWGRRTLALFFESAAEEFSQPIGEAWLSSLDCKIEGRSVPRGVRTLSALWQSMENPERGTALAGLSRFPLLVKILFTSDKLSVQVHPDDEFARKHEREPWGKSEVWYVLEAEPGAWVRVGLAAGVAPSKLNALLGTTAVEEALRKIAVRRGDVVSIPAGTLHSIGPGLILCEIQQHSDVTYRVYDYDRPGLDGRPRELHMDKARAAVKIDTPQAGLYTHGAPKEGGERPVLFSGNRFIVEHFEANTRVSLPSDPKHFDLILTLAGAGSIKTAGEEMKFKQVEAFLVAANAGGIEIVPDRPSRWLRTYPVGQWQ